MSSLISALNKTEQQKLLEDLNYLNVGEIRTFCKEHAIPYTIYIETEGGNQRKTSDKDRKGVVLDRIRHYLKTGDISPATCFPENVTCFDDFPKKLKATDQLFYGQYHKKNKAMLDLLKELTDGAFKDGAIARILAREFWSKGVAPTYREYAEAWLDAKENYKKPNSEWAFLSDRADRKGIENWKAYRTEKAKAVLDILDNLPLE